MEWWGNIHDDSGGCGKMEWWNDGVRKSLIDQSERSRFADICQSREDEEALYSLGDSC
jgi:hypothetical protein